MPNTDSFNQHNQNYVLDDAFQNEKKAHEDHNSNNFEFQYLHGVPMSDMIKIFKEKKYKVRTYVPFGENWYEYSIRRIKENPNISKYIIQNLFK